MNSILQQNLPAIRELCGRNHVRSLHAFGSVIRDDFRPDSDIDLLVEFDSSTPGNSFRRFFEFKEALERLLGRQVDLISSRAITNPFFKQEVETTKSAIYAA